LRAAFLKTKVFFADSIPRTSYMRVKATAGPRTMRQRTTASIFAKRASRATSTRFKACALTFAVAAIVALLAAATTGAFWTVGGTGSGAASAEFVASVTLTPSTATSDLYPGRSGDVGVSIANGNTYQAFVGSLVLDTGRGTNGFSVDGGHSGCDVVALSFTTQSNGGTGWFVPAGSTLDLDLANAVSLDTGAASVCQGATFTVFLLAAP
jgi:hypothetical protein